ncbi:MAG TPA: PP2C family protein-serine/threonine phosphatase [Acidobacteriaceae bacterium]|jgi:sigma-B regulation protein RsbU (phosphoserine phosphatase)|nr:PP2C family protein-serine/threonine phosphatase [Acidobacteriaceae bacterium]
MQLLFVNMYHFIRMCLLDVPLTASDVLHAYLHDEPLLFLSSAFITVAIVSVAFCLIRRRFDPLLVFLAMFAYLYGQRLRIDSSVLRMGVPYNEFFVRIKAAINYTVPIPALAFFDAAGFLGRRGKTIVIALGALFLSLVIATLVFGPNHYYDWVNNLLVIFAIPALAVRSHLMRSSDPDFRVIRIGLLCFVIPSIFDNIRDFWHPSRIEPYGFAIFLGCLGYVAARRLLRRDQELGEMRAELELAQRMQLSILPTEFPASRHFSAAALYVPMTSVAGDFYDFLNVGATAAGILIADVSGHGVPAALIASMVKMAATSQRTHAADPALLLSGMNAALCGNTQSQFVTAAYVHLDAEAGEMRYAAAGHPPMLLLRNGAVSEIIENGLMLAVTESADFTQLTMPFLPGDRLILYTDGILEARNEQGQLFGEDRLHTMAKQTAALDQNEAASQIIAAVQDWSRIQDDDLTIIVCDFEREELADE